jgi:hypothetical protein
MSSGLGNNDFGKIHFNTEIGKVFFGNTKVYEANAPYLTFSSPNTFSIATFNNTKNWDGSLEYSTNGTTWTTWAGTAAINAALSDGKYKLYMRGTNNTKITGNINNYRWVLTGSNIACTGNIENLLDHAKVAAGLHPTMASYCYYGMFRDCTGLTAAPALPATALEASCYYNMFYGCTGLTAAPALPATALVQRCYYSMFYGCTGLTAAPALPATMMKDYCYFNMFRGCTKFKVSATQTGAYSKAWRIPKSGSIATNLSSWNTNMLTDTGGTFTDDPSINTTYYVENDPVE